MLAPDVSGFPAVAMVTDVVNISFHNCVSTVSCVPVFDGVPDIPVACCAAGGPVVAAILAAILSILS